MTSKDWACHLVLMSMIAVAYRTKSSYTLSNCWGCFAVEGTRIQQQPGFLSPDGSNKQDDGEKPSIKDGWC